jgi:hypothetical protein
MNEIKKLTAEVIAEIKQNFRRYPAAAALALPYIERISDEGKNPRPAYHLDFCYLSELSGKYRDLENLIEDYIEAIETEPGELAAYRAKLHTETEQAIRDEIKAYFYKEDYNHD